MGANESSILSEPDVILYPSMKPKLSDIPESCVASVLSYLDPPEICRLARLNRAFRDASSADFIWESKLPSSYAYILKLLLQDEKYRRLRKRDVYALLSKPNPFDDGTKEVWIDKSTGGVCLSISWRAMTITGIDDRRYWNHISTTESRFQTMAYLQQIWWLEVVGDFEFQFPSGTYSLFFRLKLGKENKRLSRWYYTTSENIHGWDKKPVQFQLSTSDGQHATRRCVLDNIGKWVNYHVGDFVVQDYNSLMRIKYSLSQIDCTHNKGGLCLDSVLICPFSVGKNLDILI
ncbi:OLC1v1039103C1 [Oldenlandia corymbosa var. corymbosa]|uniref:OLC1v1039103C1 n=1 Tax=Oldenlandia corymbosa var. corymbosa TaxID=529605 RepID=A0AAV1D1E0_OLDCO|nr:OLC1v1039103C1 [Oldenlandia corymbosa var. corymbosa]